MGKLKKIKHMIEVNGMGDTVKIFFDKAVYHMGTGRKVKQFTEKLPPVEPNRLVFMSNPDYSDNARVLSEYLVTHGYLDKYEIVWLVSEPDKYEQYAREGLRFVKEKEKKTTEKLTTSKATTKKNEPTVKDEISCTLNVECKSILNNMDKLKDGHSEYVPANGYIIKGYKYTAKAGFTAYDALKKACEDNGIKLTAKSSMYGTYVSGINNIDEFDCGSQSGWMYSINGNRPNVSASSQRENDGDEITFDYVCEYQ